MLFQVLLAFHCFTVFHVVCFVSAAIGEMITCIVSEAIHPCTANVAQRWMALSTHTVLIPPPTQTVACLRIKHFCWELLVVVKMYRQHSVNNLLSTSTYLHRRSTYNCAHACLCVLGARSFCCCWEQHGRRVAGQEGSRKSISVGSCRRYDWMVWSLSLCAVLAFVSARGALLAIFCAVPAVTVRQKTGGYVYWRLAFCLLAFFCDCSPFIWSKIAQYIAAKVETQLIGFNKQFLNHIQLVFYHRYQHTFFVASHTTGGNIFKLCSEQVVLGSPVLWKSTSIAEC